MVRTISKVVVRGEVGPLQLAAGCTYVHDAELEGDENLAIGQRVEVLDDAGRYFAAVVAGRRDRYWRLLLTAGDLGSIPIGQVSLDLVADLDSEDEAGNKWSTLARAVDPRIVFPGAVLRAGRRPGAWTWAKVVAVDDDGQVHFRPIPESEASEALVDSIFERLASAELRQPSEEAEEARRRRAEALRRLQAYGAMRLIELGIDPEETEARVRAVLSRAEAENEGEDEL